MLVDKIIFQCVEISFHRSIIVRISCFTHTLGDTKFFAEFRELFGSVLAALIRMYQKLTQINFQLRVDCFCQRPLSQVSCYVSLCYACNDTSIMKVYNRAIIISIGEYIELPEKPSQPEYFIVFLNKSISL